MGGLGTTFTASPSSGLQPLIVAALTWLLAGHRPRALDRGVGFVAALGIELIVIRPGADVDRIGVLAAVGANVSFSVGVVRTKRFAAPPIGSRRRATADERSDPPALSMRNVAGFACLSLATPITGAAFGWAILDQSLSPLQLTGFVMTIAAIAPRCFLPPAGARPADERPRPVPERRPPDETTVL